MSKLQSDVEKLKKALKNKKEQKPDVFLEKIRKLDPELAKLSDAQLSDLLRKLIGAE